MALVRSLSLLGLSLQQDFWPELAGETGPLMERHQQFVMALAAATPERFVQARRREGRPCSNRAPILRAFLAKAIWNLGTTRALIDLLKVDTTLRRLCGWCRAAEVPSEATFSRAFAAFAACGVGERMHESLVRRSLGRGGVIVGHVARDATAIQARERPGPKPERPPRERRKRGRPRKGEARPKRTSRIERQRNMGLREMLADLPRDCDVGMKTNAKGFREKWTGWKLHMDTAEFGVPVCALLSSASLHDSQAAIPLATMTGRRVVALYDVMDAAYDSAGVKAAVEALGRVPVVDPNPRRDTELKERLSRERRAKRAAGAPCTWARHYGTRGAAERANARLKDEFGGRHLRVRGHAKAFLHLMMGVVALSVDQLAQLGVPP